MAPRRCPAARQAHHPDRRRSGHQSRPGDGAVRGSARDADRAGPRSPARDATRPPPARAASPERRRASLLPQRRPGSPARGWLFLRRTTPPLNFPYLLRPGGSVPLGCVGYVEAAAELAAQIRVGELPAPSHIVVALGSGGTAAGLAAGLKLAGLDSRLVCVLVNDVIRVDPPRSPAWRAERCGSWVGMAPRSAGSGSRPEESGWSPTGSAPGTATRPRSRQRDRPDRRSRGSTLEPVYTAKAMAALLALNRREAFGDGPVLFWHTYRPARPGHPRRRSRGARRHRPGHPRRTEGRPGPSAAELRSARHPRQAEPRRWPELILWIDCTAAAHPLVMRPIIERLEAAGHRVSVTAREYGQTPGRPRPARDSLRVRGAATRDASVEPQGGRRRAGEASRSAGGRGAGASIWRSDTARSIWGSSPGCCESPPCRCRTTNTSGLQRQIAFRAARRVLVPDSISLDADASRRGRGA